MKQYVSFPNGQFMLLVSFPIWQNSLSKISKIDYYFNILNEFSILLKKKNYSKVIYNIVEILLIFLALKLYLCYVICCFYIHPFSLWPMFCYINCLKLWGLDNLIKVFYINHIITLHLWLFLSVRYPGINSQQ